MLNGDDVRGNLREIANALADSGRCADFWDVEMELLARGHSAAEARQVTGDEQMRVHLNQRCSEALRQRV